MSEQLYPKPKKDPNKESFLDSLRTWEVGFVQRYHFTGEVTWKRSYFTKLGARFSVWWEVKFGQTVFDEAHLTCRKLPYL